MRTIYVVQGIVDHDFTEILTAYSAEADAESFMGTCEEYDRQRPKDNFDWGASDKTKYHAWRRATDTWAKYHPAGENGEYFDYYEIKEVELV